MGAVTVRAATASLNLSYQLVTGEGSAVAVDEVVNLRSTETSLAGIRRWFDAPDAIVAVRILYGDFPNRRSAVKLLADHERGRFTHENGNVRGIEPRRGAEAGCVGRCYSDLWFR